MLLLLECFNYFAAITLFLLLECKLKPLGAIRIYIAYLSAMDFLNFL